jgi:hypothetical protein
MPDPPLVQDNGDGSTTLVSATPTAANRILLRTAGSPSLFTADMPIDASVDILANAGFVKVELKGDAHVCNSQGTNADCTGTPTGHMLEVDLKDNGGEANVLVIANETVVGDPLLDRIRERAGRSPASFLIICPQSDPSSAEHPEAERRLRRALAVLRAEGIDAHGQVAHPDPYTAAMQAIHDERTDEIIVSTFAPERSPWMKRNLIQRLHNDSKLPVEHVVLEEAPVS